MYMLSRAEAQRLVNKYSNHYTDNNPNMPFSADWTITKDGATKRLVYPMLAIEDGLTTYDHAGQTEYHKLSHTAHVNASNYI